MESVQMYWGSSDVPSGVPSGLTAAYNPNTGRGLQVSGEVAGPGCGAWSCGQYWVDLTYLGRFHLSTSRMPERGCVFYSAPEINFSGKLFGETEEGSVAGGVWFFDDSSAKCGISIKQTIYSDVYEIGRMERSWPRVIDIDDENWDWDSYTIPATLRVPHSAGT